MSFFRQAIWGFENVKKCVRNCVNSGTLLESFKDIDIDCCIALCYGQAYYSFYLLDPKFGDDHDKFCGLFKSIVSSFHKALFLMERMKGQ